MSSTSGSSITTSNQQNEGYGDAFWKNIIVGLVVNLLMIAKVYCMARRKGRKIVEGMRALLKDVLDTSLTEQTMRKLTLKKNASAASSDNGDSQQKSPKKIKLDDLMVEDHASVHNMQKQSVAEKEGDG